MNIARSSITERIDAVTDVTRDYWQTVVPAPRSEAQDLRAAHLRKDVTGTACEHCAVGA